MRVLLLAVPLLLLLASCRPDCSIDTALQEFAGPEAINCGHVSLDPSLDEQEVILEACYADSLAHGRAFRGSIQYPGIDSRVVRGAAGTGAGDVALFFYDGCPSGCGDDDPHLYRTRCAHAVTMDGVLTCDGVIGADHAQICP